MTENIEKLNVLEIKTYKALTTFVEDSLVFILNQAM